MTGEKNRYTTTEKLWNLDNKTLKTPAHDEMVLWLLNKDNVSTVFQFNHELKIAFDPTDKFLPDQYNKWSISQYLHKNTNNIWDLLELKQNINNIYPNVNAEYFIVWAEMVEEFHKCKNHLVGNFDIKIGSEVPITAKNGFLVGYIDIKIDMLIPSLYEGNYYKLKYSQPESYFLEVKPTIKSFGETLRQLNTYKHYLNTDEMYLFTTDLRFKEAFESQGIKVLTYPDQ